MSKRPFRVGRSSAGLGLFATKPFKKGAFVVRYTGRKVTDAESERREARGARYMFEINSFWAIDGSSRSNTARYVNHSCRPNVETIVRDHKVKYVARRRIKPDEEITVDYGKDYFDAYIKAKGCRCIKCREKRNARRRAQRAKIARKNRERARMRSRATKRAPRRSDR
jgi:SET domain-containing protein